MNGRINVPDKKPDLKNQNQVIQINAKSDISKSTDSPVDRIMFLQRTIGNQAVAGLIESRGLLTKLRADIPILQRAKADEFPGYSQGNYNTCGAASLISALMIWDREKKDPASPNDIVVNACNIILTHMDDNRNALIKGWKDSGKDGEKLYELLFSKILTSIRDAARLPAAKISETEYQLLGRALVILFNNASSGGMGKADIFNLQKKLGLSGPQSAVQADSFDALFADPILQSLNAGQIARISWYVKNSQGQLILDPIHVFLVGRFQKGTWFMSDQGMNPPTELEAGSLTDLKAAIMGEIGAGRSWIHTGTKPTVLLPPPWTGVMLLGDRGGVEKQAENVILVPGTFIAQVDATAICCGENLIAWDFIARHYSFSDAEAAFNSSGSGHGGLIIENPTGLFHVFKTSPLKDKDNLKATTIDEGDSTGGYLMNKNKYYHAWLKLCMANMCNPNFFKYR